MRPYLVSGLRVSSEIELPAAIARGDEHGGADVHIRLAPVPAELPGAIECGPNWDLRERELLLRVPGVARLLIADGSRIDVAIEADSTVEDAAVFLLSSAFGVLLHQRGTTVLHGAAVARNGAAIVICGPSGAGKSTLAAALCRRGCTLVSDDLAAIGFDAGRRLVVHADSRRLRLWSDSIKQLDLGASQGMAVRTPFQKFLVDPGDPGSEVALLHAIYVLRERRPPLDDGIETLSRPDAARVLDRESFRPTLRRMIGDPAAHLAGTAAILGRVRVAELTFPRDFDALDAAADAVLADWGAHAA